MKLKQAASEAVRQPDCFNNAVYVLCSLYLALKKGTRTLSLPSYMKRDNVQLGPIHSFRTSKPSHEAALSSSVLPIVLTVY